MSERKVFTLAANPPSPKIEYTHKAGDSYVNLTDPNQIANFWLGIHQPLIEMAHSGMPSRTRGIGAADYDQQLYVPSESSCNAGEARNLIQIIRDSFPDDADSLLNSAAEILWSRAESHYAGSQTDAGKYKTLAACLFMQTSDLEMTSAQKNLAQKQQIELPVVLGVFNGNPPHQAGRADSGPQNRGVAPLRFEMTG